MAGTLTFTMPTDAIKGDTLIALLSHSAVDAVSAPPAGWALITTLGSGSDALDVYGHMVGDGEPVSIVFTLASNSSEWLGEVVTLTGTSPNVLIESSASAAFSSATTLTTAGATAQQAIDLILSVWTCAGAPTLTLPAGFTPIDNFSSSTVTPRSMLLGYEFPGVTGALTFAGATASASTTGRSFTLVLRDRNPPTPGALVDLVPGNIGLVANDTRPPR